LTVAVRPAARRDILEGEEFYEQRRQGLGGEFVTEVLAALDRIEAMPEMYGTVWQQVRAAGVKRFGYVVYYRVLTDHVEVLAVMHGGRRASEWQSRA
jgi:plasmid stabilization system protein ParE